MSKRATQEADAWEERCRKEKQRSRRKLFRLLRRQKGLAKVQVEYDGYGDEGQIENITFLGRSGKPRLRMNDRELSQAVEEYVLLLLPRGWENNSGACGTVAIDVSSRKVRVVHNDRYEAYETNEFEDG